MTRKLAIGIACALGCSHPAPPPPVAPVVEKTVQVNAPGEPVELAKILPAGYVTVVDFWSESCHACIELGGMLAVGVAQEPKVVVRKIDVGDGFTPVAQAYKIDALPHFFIYDKLRRLRYDLVGADCLDATTYARKLAAE
ncbi:MAG TPA: thioredoxin family protein [Kofleriaceae bacterium]|nr:thioredoxin family protein [Kofleriaceae bacterium]